MCCGGEMAVFLEVLGPAPRLYVFGAGYIARPLAAVAASCGFEVRVVDERSDWATPARFPVATVELREPEAYLRELESTPDDFVVVATHDHALDQRLVQILLRRPFRFVGMIGSIPKQRKFALRLKSRGYSNAEIARLHTPLGVSIGADTPEEIAVSVMAQLIAVRRGARGPAGWTPPERAGSPPEPASDSAGSLESTPASTPRSQAVERGSTSREQETA
jgi:xanthine dehydrogenase accessory factor